MKKYNVYPVEKSLTTINSHKIEANQFR